MNDDFYYAIRLGYPPDLAKACIDNFYTVVCLNNGQIFEISSAQVISENWVKLKLIEDGETRQFQSMNAVSPFARGVTVRLSEIAWVADCPCGS